jgi:hypothetical protein
MANEKHENRTDDLIAACLFRLDQCVYNRDTKEHGLIREVYEQDGGIVYVVWLPATTPHSLRFGHNVSDWDEGVLEPSDKLLGVPERLPPLTPND